MTGAELMLKANAKSCSPCLHDLLFLTYSSQHGQNGVRRKNNNVPNMVAIAPVKGRTLL